MPAATSHEPFNAYHQWLGLPPDATSPTYYQILGLAEFESDATRIAQAGDRAITRVRSFRPGSHAKEWSRLLDEVGSAKSCLLDADVKREYDRCLKSGRSSTSSPAENSAPATIEYVKARAPLDPNRFPPGMAPPGAAAASPSAPVALPPGNGEILEAEVLPPAAAVDSLLPPAAVDSWLPAAALPQAMPVGYGSPMAPVAMPAMPAVDPMAPLAAPVGMPTYAPPAYAAPTYGMPPVPMYPPPNYAAPAYSAPGYGAPAYPAPTASPMVPAAPFPIDVPAPIAPLAEPKPVSVAASVATVLAQRRRRAQRNSLIAAVAGCLLLATGVVGYANRDKLMKLGQPQVAQAPTNPGTVDTSGDSSAPLPRVVEGSLPKTPAPKPEPKPAPTPEPAPMPEATPDTAPPMPEPEPKPEPTPEPTPPTTPEPTPPPMPEPAPPPMPTKAELAALGKALAAGKAALTKYDFLAADEQIAAAETLAKLPEHQEMVARLKEVALYVKQFRNAVSEGLKNLQVGAELKVGTSTMVVVVAVSPERLTIRRAGGNVTYPLDELPAGLTMALADSWFKADDPVNRVVKGAYFAVAEGDVASHREKAKKYWEEATAAGVDAKPLLPFLTDNYDLEKQAEATKTDKGNTEKGNTATESKP